MFRTELSHFSAKQFMGNRVQFAQALVKVFDKATLVS